MTTTAIPSASGPVIPNASGPTQSGVLGKISAATNGVPVLGAMTWWSINDCVINHDTLATAFDQAGLPREWLPKKVTDKNAYLKAARIIEAQAKDKMKDNRNKDYLLRKAVDDADSCVMVLLRETRQPGRRDVQHETVAKLSYDKKSRTVWSVVVDEADAVVSEVLLRNPLKEGFRHFKTSLTQTELRGLILHIIDRELMATSVRDKGGVYFAPRGKHHHLDGLAIMVEKVSPGSTLSICPIADLEKARGTLFHAMEEELKKDLSAAVRDIEQSCKEAGKGKSTTMRPKTLAAQMEHFAFLRKKAAAYSSLMSYSVEDIKKEIAAAEKKVRGLL